MVIKYYFSEQDKNFASYWIKEIDRLIPRETPQSDYLEREYGQFLEFLHYTANPKVFEFAQNKEGSLKLINRMANWSQLMNEDGLLFVHNDIDDTLTRIVQDVLEYNSRENKYRIETLDNEDDYQPQLLNYDSNGVFKNKQVFHANLEKLLNHWTVEEKQGFIPKFDETYDESIFNNPSFRKELYNQAPKISIGLPMPRVYYSKKIGSIMFENGRHRTRFIEYLGARDIYILIPDDEEQLTWFNKNVRFNKL